MRSRLLYLLRFALVVLLSFLVLKGCFLLLVPAEGALSMGDIFAVLYHGLSLDFSVLGYLLVIPLLTTAVSCFFRAFPARRALRPYHILTAALISIVGITDVRLYPFWGFKLDASIFLYLDRPGEAFASVSLPFILLSIFLVLVIGLAVGFALDRTTEKRWPELRRGGLYALPFVLLLGPTFLMIRGGVSQATANVGQVYFSDRQYLNHAAVNPLFSLFSSLGKAEDYDAEYNAFDEKMLGELTKDLFPAESLEGDTLLTTRRPNIVLLILESYGARYTGVLGEKPEVSPHFDSLAREGVLFSRCYANSYRTDRGLISILSGYTSFPTHSVMKLPVKSRTLPSIAGSLREAGYATSFLYGGDANFTGMKGYLLGSGYQQVTDDHTLPRSLPRTNWGVPDGPAFDVLYDEIVRMPADRPWYKTLLTLSSHEPFDVPYKRLPAPVSNAFAYLDESLGRFVARLKATPQWKDLLIICVADHGYSELGSDDRNSTAVHPIPLLEHISTMYTDPYPVEELAERLGIDAFNGTTIRRLSGGQKQRIAIVRALCMNPEVILLDEITAALDPGMVRGVLDVVLELAREGMSMIIVTHEMGFAEKVADRIAFMDQGRIIEEGAPAAFFARPQTERARVFLNGLDY